MAGARDAMQVDVLGPVRVRPSCRPGEPLLAKERALLAVLALDVGRTVPRLDCELALWGDDPPRTAAKSLQSHVSRVRRCLGAAAVETSTNGYRLALASDAVDAGRLLATLATATSGGHPDPVARRHRLLAAESLWRGEPLTDLADTPQREQKVEWLREQWRQVRDARIEADLEAGAHEQACRELGALVLADPLREPLWRLLMLALYRSGRQVDALRAYQRVRSTLGDEWGVDPSAPLQRLHWQILRQDPQLDRQPPEPALMVPSALSETVGRARAIERVADTVQSHRLVTLHGTAGVGKSRLAMEVAKVVRSQFPDGVWWVDLTTVTDVPGVRRQVASALGIAAAPHLPPEEAVRKHLQHRSLLLVLDNCEHVVEDVAREVIGWLEHAADLRVLATSRVVLGADGETRWQVPPLEVPVVGVSADRALEYDAVQLFLQHRGWLPADVGADTAAQVAALCRALDGLPLAVQLAAAQCQHQTVREVNQRLGTELRDARQVARVQHHASLRLAIDWSYSSLSPRCQRVLDWLSVFPGEFDARAAESIGGAATGGREDAHECLSTLRGASLVDTRPLAGTTRHRLLFVVREFASARLGDRGEGVAAARAFRAHFRDGAARTHPDLNGPQSGAGLAWATRELVNLRAAVDMCVAADEPSLALPLVAVIGRAFWALPSNVAQGLSTLQAVVEKSDSVEADPDGLAWAWVELVTAAYLIGDIAWATRALERAEQLFSQVDDRAGLASVAWHRGAMYLLAMGDLGAAEEVLRKGCRLGRDAGVSAVEAWSAAHLAQVQCFGSRVSDETASALSRAIAIGDAADHQLQAHLLMLTTVVLLDRQDFEGSVAQAHACETYSKTHHQAVYEQASLALQATAYAFQGLTDAARPPALRAAQIALDTGNAMQLGVALQPLARIAELDGDAVRAARLWGAARARAPEWPVLAPLYGFARARDRLGDGFTAEATLGESLSDEQSLTLAVG